jgi:hypothetical protein
MILLFELRGNIPNGNYPPGRRYTWKAGNQIVLKRLFLTVSPACLSDTGTDYNRFLSPGALTDGALQ